MKMNSPRKQQTSSPRFSRGLELSLWIGLLCLLAYGWTHARVGNITPDETAVKAPLVDVAGNIVLQDRPRASQEANHQDEWVQTGSSAAPSLAKALAAVQAEEDSQKREEMIEALVGQIAVADIPSTLDDLRSLAQDGLNDDLSVRIVRRWAENDAHAAADWVEQLPEGQMREDALSGVAIEWANTGLKDAAAWAAQLPDPVEHDATLLAIANEAIRSEPMEALDLAVNLPSGTQRDELIRHAAMEWAAQDGESASSWARQIPDIYLRNQVLSAVATAWSESDPLSAATLANGEVYGRGQADAAIGIVQRWAQKQPEQAAAWVEQFPAGELKQTAIENLAPPGVTMR